MRIRLPLIRLAAALTAVAFVGFPGGALRADPRDSALPSCSNDDVAAHAIGLTTSDGNTRLTISVTNVSQARCGVIGYPALSFLAPDGATVPVYIAVPPVMSRIVIFPFGIDPGASASTVVSWKSSAPAPQTACDRIGAVRVGLQTDGSARPGRPSSVAVDSTICGDGAGRFATLTRLEPASRGD